MADSWRVLEDQGKIAPPEGPGGAAPEAGGRPVWPLLLAGLAIVLGASAWLLMTGSAGGVLSVNAVHAAALDGAPGGSPAHMGGRSADPRPSATAMPAVIVEVNGAVRRPGVYRLSADARVADAIAAAGGYGPRVDASATEAVNLAAKVTDGQQVHVPVRGERVASNARAQAALTSDAPAPGAGPAADPAGPVNVNIATSTQLEALPGIGPATAAKIIAARTDRPFASVDELRGRKVVGQATLEKIRGLVTVN